MSLQLLERRPECSLGGSLDGVAVDPCRNRRKATLRQPRSAAGVAAAEMSALLEYRRPAGTVNCTVDASASEQRGVRRVHDRVDVLLRDVALNELDSFSSAHVSG